MSKRVFTDENYIPNVDSNADSSTYIIKKAKHSKPTMFLRMLEAALLIHDYDSRSLGYFDEILEGDMYEIDQLISYEIATLDDFWSSIGYSLLEKAAEAGLLNIVQVLLKYEKYDTTFSAQRFKVLYTACMESHVEVVKSLLEHGFDHNMMGEDDEGHCETCTSFASKRGKVPIVKLLLMRGADANLADADNNSPLVWACCSNKLDAARCLLDHGADVNVIGSYGETPMVTALCYPQHHKKELIQLLLERADPAIPNEEGKTALDYVADGSGIVQMIKNVQLEHILK